MSLAAAFLFFGIYLFDSEGFVACKALVCRLVFGGARSDVAVALSALMALFGT